MRIICDHCGHSISGKVQRMTENLNFHPECLNELVRTTQPELKPITESYQRSPRRWLEKNQRRQSLDFDH